MRFWLTSHWAPREGRSSRPPSGIYLQEGNQEVGAAIRPVDRVLIYQAEGGPTLVEEDDGEKVFIRHHGGSGGIVSVGRVTSRLTPDNADGPDRYLYGKRIREIWWRWRARTESISHSGFVPRREINRILGSKPHYNFRGFGDGNSGLKEISKEDYERLVDAFKRRTRRLRLRNFFSRARSKLRRFGFGESKAHRRLKDFVASVPSLALGEEGLRTIQKEFPFPTGDRADVVLEDHVGKLLGVEIEVDVDGSRPEGILQAIKYRFMLAAMHGKPFSDTRSVLVAYAISPEAARICRA